MLQPLVMGRAVSIHPLAVVLGIAAGGVLAGIVGALLAVPLIAFLNNAMRVLLAPDPQAAYASLETEEGVVIEAESDDVGARELTTAGPRGAAAPERSLRPDAADVPRARPPGR